MSGSVVCNNNFKSVGIPDWTLILDTVRTVWRLFPTTDWFPILRPSLNSGSLVPWITELAIDPPTNMQCSWYNVFFFQYTWLVGSILSQMFHCEYGDGWEKDLLRDLNSSQIPTLFSCVCINWHKARIYSTVSNKHFNTSQHPFTLLCIG